MEGMGMWQKVEKLLKAKGLNWAKLCRIVGEHEPRMSKWRHGQGEPDRNQLLRIARALDADVEYLADDAMDEPRVPHLADDERAVLEVYRALRPQLDQAKAIRALSAASNASLHPSQRATIMGQPHDPETGFPVGPEETQAAKRRRQA
jgi:transcriptional regulator with XRE-family HTH domain